MRNGEIPRERGNRQTGYNLVILVVAVTVLSILLAVAAPMWSTVIRREKEEELIFRGLQYAEAIRVFQNRYSRPPTRLEELLEIKPRSLRQLYKDPMTEDGKWGIIFAGQPVGEVTPQEEGEAGRPAFGGPGRGEVVAVGPITGVHSRSKETGIRTFLGQERYNQWMFTVDLVISGLGMGQRLDPRTGQPVGGGGLGLGGGAGNPTGLPDLSSRWLGRPLPGFANAPQGHFPEPTGPGGQPRPQPGRRPQRGGGPANVPD
jgi:type II secretory pathway pseudopilin PulG